MSVIVTDDGFAPDNWSGGFADPADPGARAIELDPEADLEALAPRFASLDMIRVQFPVFRDGRGFSIARQLRLLGYRGRLRAAGHMLADQYTMARRCGFDEVEIDADLAARQPEEHWLARADWAVLDYQERLRRDAALIGWQSPASMTYIND